MWLTFAHLIIFGLSVFAITAVNDPHPQRDSILISICIGILVLIIYTGPWAILTAVAGGVIGYSQK
jgi:uncharacterized protein YhhL (DUF1145 family)